MKLKIRVEPQDFVAFLAFSAVLLYVVAIVILNLQSFAATQTLHGLNPFPAFSPDRIGATLAFFLFILVYIIMQVSSKIFNTEKGTGFVIGAKKDKGYSRWATEREFKKELKKVLPGDESSEVAGIPMINNGKEIWVDDGDFHSLIIGSTGSGKTEMIVQPMVKILAKKGESMIITDPKGEIYERTAEELRDKGYNIVLLNFRDPQKGNCWNPLTLPYSLYQEGNSDKATELLDDLARNILYDESSAGQDPFWENTSADYFAGVALALFDDADESQINLNSINLVTTVGEEKFKNTTYIKEYFSTKNPSSPAYINVVSTLMAANETKSSILSVFKQKIKLFSSRENLSEMLCRSDFDMKDIGRKKTAVFIVVQDEKKTYHSLVTIFIKQCYETLIGVAQESGGKLPYRTNFILDEFANMPPLKDVTTMVTAARSRAMRFNFIIQNFAQLNQVYGKENGETIVGNCGNIIYLISSELDALEKISKMSGEEKSKEKDKTASTPLISVSDLQRLPRWSTVVLRLRQMPFKTVMTPNFKLEEANAWGKPWPKADYPQREKKEINIFDLKKHINDMSAKKFEDALSAIEEESSSSKVTSSPLEDLGLSLGNESVNFGENFSPEDLIAKIDAKIAELEAEEKAQEEELKRLAAEEATNEEQEETQNPMPIPVSNQINPGFLDIDKIAMSAKDIFSGEITKAELPEVVNNDTPVAEPLEEVVEEIAQEVPETLEINVEPEEEIIEAEEVPLNEPIHIEEPVKSIEEHFEHKYITVQTENEKPKEEEKPAQPEQKKVSDDQFFDDFFFDE